MVARIKQTNNTPFERVAVDSITIDIVENALSNARHEMDAVLFRTAMSPGIREQGDAFPLSGLTQIYASDGESNFGKIGTPEIDAKIEQTLAELDPEKARAFANELDTMLFEEVFSLPLFQSPGNVAVRDTLANFGAFGLADADYTKIGFIK